MTWTATLEINNCNIANPDIPNYTVVGRCLSGSRHYSENMTYEEALAAMPKYVSVVEYFGGGTVDLWENDNRILKTKVIF